MSTATMWTDDELMLAVVWHGGSTLNVHEIAEEGGFGRVFVGREVYAFTRYGDDQSTDLRPTLAEVAEAAGNFFTAYRAGEIAF